MHSATLLAALTWHLDNTEENREYIETEARRATRGADPLGAAEAEEIALREALAQAREEFERVEAAYAASKSEEDRLAAGHALLALSSARLYLWAATTAKEFVAAAVLTA